MEMTELKIFKFESEEIRAIEKDGIAWFVARDVCNFLDLGNLSMAMDRLDNEEKLTSVMLMSGQNREVFLINESGLYSLVLTSRKPEAKKFKKWVTSEVLPAIRKNGSYSINKPKSLIVAEALIAANDIIQEQLKLIEDQKPKVEFADTLISSGKKFGVGDVTKLLKLSVGRTRFFQILRNDKIFMHDNTPYGEYIESGYFLLNLTKINMGDREEFVKTPLVTARGMNWLYKKYKHLVRKDTA